MRTPPPPETTPQQGLAPLGRNWLEQHEALVIGILSAIAVVVALVPRWTQLGAQSVWTDEQFTLGQTTGSLHHLRVVGHTEIHTPFFATLLWLWNHLVAAGTAGAVRARAFSALVTALAIVCVPAMLRRTPLTALTRWLLTAAIATSGLGFLYGQEIRSYGLLWALSVALTVNHVCLELGETPSRSTKRRCRAHLVLGLLASATHLFGLVLAACSIVTLMTRRRIRPARGLVWLAVVALPEAVWIIHGLVLVPGFAAGTGWNSRPDLLAITQLLQDVFAWGRPTISDGGFLSLSPAGLMLALAVLTIALNRYWSRPAELRQAPPSPALRAAVGLALLALLTIASSWLASQITPLWTPRNLIIVDPALRMALALFVVAASRSARTRALLSSALVVILTVSLISVAAANRHPWKTDFRDAVGWRSPLASTTPECASPGNISPWWAEGNHRSSE
ncbi:MAG: hypothetical protein LKI24_11280 [Acidipropionibacterium sp.]|jgi:hypothetical protein|nr:hypothetical protein [Acidipropionibacterium sp.]